MFKIKILDTIECICDPALANIIRPCLSYPAVFYKQGMYRKIRTEYEKSTMTKAGDVYFFFTGLLPRVLNFCKENNIPVNVEGELEKIPFSEPKLKGKTLRSEQIRLVTTALERQRGVLVSPTGCIAEGTFIRYNRRKKGCKRAIEHMFNLYHPDKNKKYPPRFNPEFPTKVRSFKEDENRILLHEIEDVVFSGEKECLSLTLEDGKTLQATPDHLIMTQKGWVQLGKLKKDIHLVMCDTPHTFKKVKSYKPFKEQCFCNLWYHPYGVSVPDRYGREGRTIRVEKSKITYEAHLNNLSVEEFLHCLRHDPERSKHFKFIDSKKHHIHHKDREHQNNSLDNLELMEKHKHLKLHAIKNKTNFHQGTPEFTKIKSIKKAGVKKTYDIICKDPYRNFSANDIIVHNSGKTLIALAVISSFMDKDTNVLWLCHTKDLMYQAGREAEKELGVEVGYIGDGNNDHDFKVTMATRQSFIKVAPELGWKYDVVVIDEVHHMAKFDSNYAELMRSVLSPVRIGLTATIPKDKQAVLAIEAFLGPVIEEITVKEGQERGTMAEIKMKFLKVPLSHSIRDLRKYQDVYDAGVVNRREQHELIARTCKRHVGEGDAILILVTRIQHGENILSELKRQGVKAYFAQGNTESSVRNDLKDALNNKDIHCLIATTIFQEGINIPELNVLINAAGGKSEIRTIQAIGRGLRVTDTKKVLTCYDIMSLDHPYLVSHLAERLAVYSEMRWLE